MRLYTLDLYGEKFNSSQFAELPFIKPYTERTIKLISFGEKAKRKTETLKRSREIKKIHDRSK